MRIVLFAAIAALVALPAWGGTPDSSTEPPPGPFGPLPPGFAYRTTSSGPMLTDDQDEPLYTLEIDEHDVSHCGRRCKEDWVPLPAGSNDKAVGQFTIFKRSDDLPQWAYLGRPLYYYTHEKIHGHGAGLGRTPTGLTAHLVGPDGTWAGPAPSIVFQNESKTDDDNGSSAGPVPEMEAHGPPSPLDDCTSKSDPRPKSHINTGGNVGDLGVFTSLTFGATLGIVFSTRYTTCEVKRSNRIDEFIRDNTDLIVIEAAQGRGEELTLSAELLYCPTEALPRFKIDAQKRFATLWEKAQADPESGLRYALRQVIADDPWLAKRCGPIGR